MEWTNDSLDFGEYIGDSTPKNMVFLHHTAGSHRPDWTIHGWNTDGTSTNKSRVATSWVIGGKSTRDGNDDFDGKVYRAFDEEYWAYHLGTRSSDTNGINLNKNSIGIEICNYGPLTKSKNGEYFNWAGGKVPENQVYKIEKGFRGYQYYHRYTEKQLKSTKKLLLEISERHNIDLYSGLLEMIEISEKGIVYDGIEDNRKRQELLNENCILDYESKEIKVDGIWGKRSECAWQKLTKGPFDKQECAMMGQNGLFSHTNVRLDKSDIHPQPEMIEMIKSLLG